MKKVKKAWLTAFVSIVAIVLSACGSDDTSGGSKEKDAKEIVIGTGNDMLDIAYIDEKGELTGYDVELLRVIDERLEDVSFKFESMDFSNLLLNLETGKIDMIAHNMAKNKEREEKFLFNEQHYNAIPTHVVVNEKNTDIQSIDDLAGKKVGVVPTSNASIFFEQYKKEHNLDTEILYIPTNTDITNQLKTGRIDALFSFPFSVKANNEQADAQQKIVGDPLLYTDIYFMFNKKDEELAAKIDGAVKELIEDGTISELLVEWFDEDYSDQLKD